MSKKLYFLAPMLAVAALVAPSAAQALNPHYFVNNTELAPGAKTSVVGWGNITLSSNAAPIGNSLTCHNVAGGFVEGAKKGVEGKNGKGATESFAVYSCVQVKQCPKATDVAVVNPINFETSASSLPWPSELRDVEGEIRAASTFVKVIVTCIATEGEGKGKPDQNVPFITNQIAGSKCEAQAPIAKNGTSALHPGFVEFSGEETKGLEIPEPKLPKCTLVGSTEGEVKTLGYEEQELVNTKDS